MSVVRNIDREIELQRQYYASTASSYDEMHGSQEEEHIRAIKMMFAFLDLLKIQSILDIGSGTGWLLLEGKAKYPHIKFVGIEPSEELRKIGYSKGLSSEELILGDAQQLNYRNNSFDLVCEFAALHHIPRPDLAVSEMLRVAKKAVFLSDCNNFGAGNQIVRTIKQLLNAIHLWKPIDFLKTKGKGYRISQEDGLSYNYSLFNDYLAISNQCSEVLLMNTRGKAIDLYKDTSHVALLGILDSANTEL